MSSSEKKIQMGVHPVFHLSESILQNWLNLLRREVEFLLLMGKNELGFGLSLV